MKVYIHKPKGTEFADTWLYAAWQGFTALGAHIVFFDQVEEVPYAPDNVVVTFVEDTKRYLYQNNITVPSPLNIPRQLDDYIWLKRSIIPSVAIDEVEILTLEDEDFELPIFIKPADSVKEFQGDVLHDFDDLYLMGIPPFTKVMVSQAVDMISEYRCFIYKGYIEGIKHYLGDVDKFPDYGFISAAVKTFTDAPIAYTLDVAIIEKNYSWRGYDTALIECNDAWSICNYGLDSKTYAMMLRDRWFEITGYRVFGKEERLLYANN